MSDATHHLVYLASTSQGLELERYEIERQLARNNMVNVGFSYREDGAPYDWPLVRSQIEKAELFVLLLGDDYGPMAPTGISFLHREFVHAKSLNKPILAFIKNTLPERNLSEAQRRLTGFHRIVIQQSQYRLWHLREELLSHVRASLASHKFDGGWLPVAQASTEEGGIAIGAQSQAPAAASTPAQASSASFRTKTASTPASVSSESATGSDAQQRLSGKQKLLRARQVVSLQVAAKVFEGGNLSREEVILPVRLDQLLATASTLLRNGASEDRLRAHLESIIANTISDQLLKRHPRAHAVDDVRISRGQFQQILKSWKALGLVTTHSEGGRTNWMLLSEESARYSGA